MEAQLVSRDARDSSRTAAPLARADDAVLVDTTALDPDAVLAHILAVLGARGTEDGSVGGGPG